MAAENRAVALQPLDEQAVARAEPGPEPAELRVAAQRAGVGV